MHQAHTLTLTPEGHRQIQIADHPDALSEITRPDTAMVLWRRTVAPKFQNWIDGLDPASLPKARMILPTDDMEGAVRQAFDDYGTPATAHCEELIADILHLAGVFGAIVKTPFLRLRLDVVNTDSCRRFHIDAVTARMICTYRGTGTQYGFSTDGADPEEVFVAETGSPLLLRGTNWPETPSSGLLHRSPPIAGTGETRFVMVLDPINDPDEES